MLKREYVAVLLILMFLAVMSGCALQFTRPQSDQRVLATMLKAGTFEAVRPLFKRVPEAGGYICPLVREGIMPALQNQTCADIKLKDQAVFVLGAAAQQWFPDWQEHIQPALDVLDELFGPSLDCTPEQMMYLRAFFSGIMDACNAGAKEKERKEQQ